MPTMQEVRNKFPQYDDMSDDELAGALHRKFYSDMPYPDFAAKIGLTQPQEVASGKGDRERSWSETLGDMGMSAAQGFQSGFQSLLGAGGDAQNMLGSAAQWGAEKLGASPETQQTVGNIARRVAIPMAGGMELPTTQDVNQAAESIIGPKYQPETTGGRYVRTMAELAPAAMAGPGSAGRKIAMSVIPGAAIEGTDDLTGGNQYAKAAAGIAAGLATAGRGNAGTKEMLKSVGKSGPAYAKLEADVNNAYNKLRAAGIKYDANAVDQAITDVSKLRINPQLSPDAVGLRDTFTQFAGKGMDFQDLDEMEQIATGILRHHATKPADKMFTIVILNKIRDVREKGAFITNGSVPAGQVKGLVKEAKDLARRRIIARDIGKMKDKSEWYVSGPESGLRNQFRNYGQKNYQNLSKAEEKAFKSVVSREGVLNPLHNAGSRMGQIALGSMGYAMGDVTGALVPLIGSSLARRFMEAYTRKGVDDAIKTVLAGRSAQDQAMVRDLLSKHEATVRAALSADATMRATGENWLVQDAAGNTYGGSGSPARVPR